MKREIKFCDSRIFNVNGRIHMMLIHASFVPFIRPVCYMKTFYNKLSVSKIIHNKLLYKHKIITYYIYKSCPKITIKFMQCKSLQLLYIYIYIYIIKIKIKTHFWVHHYNGQVPFPYDYFLSTTTFCGSIV